MPWCRTSRLPSGARDWVADAAGSTFRPGVTLDVRVGIGSTAGRNTDTSGLFGWASRTPFTRMRTG